MPTGVAPESTYWLVDGKEYLGGATIRHELVGAQSHLEGHISYGVRPSKRRMGYGSKILKLILLVARDIGISKALVVCNDDNVGSVKVIENNGGVLENVIKVDGKHRRRYWI